LNRLREQSVRRFDQRSDRASGDARGRAAENERLRQIIKEMQRHRFGRRAESLPVEQLLLGLEEAEQVEAEGFARERRRDPAKRRIASGSAAPTGARLPAHLPRIEQVVDVEDKSCPCCNGPLHVMGEDRSERLDIVPAQFRVIVTRRPKYACRACEEIVVQAPAPSRLVEGGIPTEATVAHVLVSKYADHLPLYRQSQIYSPPGRQPGSVHACRLGRQGGLPAAADPRATVRAAEGVRQALRRRDDGAGARSRAWSHQDRPAVRLCTR
jgi:transposase